MTFGIQRVRAGGAAAIVASLAVLSALAGGAAFAGPKTYKIKQLEWTPRESRSIPPVDMTGGTLSLQVEPLTEARENTSAIGENPEKRPPVTVVTDTDVVGFVDEHVRRQLTALGFNVVSSGGDVVLSGELRQFWIRDTGAYDGNVRVMYSLRDSSGKELWTALVSGHGENWGSQLKAINYSETISDAVLDLTSQLVGAREFTNAIRKSK